MPLSSDVLAARVGSEVTVTIVQSWRGVSLSGSAWITQMGHSDTDGLVQIGSI